MSETKENIIYKCPACFNSINDVIIDLHPDGVYRCMKCGYNDTLEGLQKKYADFRSRYKLKTVRLTLEQQRKM